MKATEEKNEVLKMIEKIKDRERRPDAGLLHMFGQMKRAARIVVDKVINDMEEEVYNKLEEDGGKKMVYKLARDRDGDRKEMKTGGRGQ